MLYAAMPKETPPLQQDMFTGQLVDTRSSYRRRMDREQQKPQQPGLFTARQVIQHEARRRPWLNDLPTYRIALESEDPRTPEEIEHDLLREAQALTSPMFGNQTEPVAEAPAPLTLPPAVMIAGLRARTRALSVPVRRRRAPLATDSPA